MGAVGCDTWDPPIHPLPTQLQHVSTLSPMGMSYLSNLTACYSHGHSSHAAPGYAQQALQDCPSSMMAPQFVSTAARLTAQQASLSAGESSFLRQLLT